MNNLSLFIFASFILLTSISGCTNDDSTSRAQQDSEPVPEKPLVIPAFNADSAYLFVARQVDLGPRNPGTDALEACRQFIEQKMNEYGANVTRQPFRATLYTGDQFDSYNIIAAFNPNARRRVILAAHYDSRFIGEEDSDEAKRDLPILGADDGGSGVGVLLEIGRLLSENPVEIGVDIIFFDAEDQGSRANEGGEAETWCLGSQYWGNNLPPKYQAKFGVLVDMVGARNAFFNKENVARVHANANAIHDLYDKVWNLANAMGKGRYFQNRTINGIIDDHFFVNRLTGIPMIDIINKPPNSTEGFGDHWHTHNDNMDVINKGTLGSVGQVVTAVVYREDAGQF